MTFTNRHIRSNITQYARIGLAVLTLLAMATGLATAAGQSSARSMALGGAYLGLAKGVDAARYNPANLGLSGYNSNSLELIGFGVNVNNNALSLGDYNTYTGAVLTESDKADIMGKIPSDGLRVTADLEAAAMSLSMGSWAFSVTGVGSANVNLSKDILDLVLNGNHLGETVSLEGSYSDAVSYVQSSLSYGREVYRLGSRQVAVGATFKYLRGMAVEQVTELTGGVTTLTTGFTGSGRMVARTATGGSGYGLDLGTSIKLNDSYTAGLSFRNVLSSLSWSGSPEEHGYIFDFDEDASDILQDDYVVSEDYSKDIDGFSTSLPTVMTLGIANTSGKLLWAVDWQQGFREDAGASSKPRLCAGIEWLGLSTLPLRAGFATGGARGTHMALGSGVHLGGFHLDFAVETGTTLVPNSAKGLNLAMSTGFGI